MTILPKAIYRFSAFPTKIPMVFLHRTRTNNFKICRETQKTTKTILRKKNRDGGIILLNFRLYYKATVTKIVWYCTETDT